METKQVADELMSAYQRGKMVEVPPSQRDVAFDMDTAYWVEAELTRRRRAEGHKTVGLKIGYANKAVWRALKMKTLVWAHMYDDTVRFAEKDDTLRVGHLVAPKLEPEVVFKLKEPLYGSANDPQQALAASEWMALGFEILDCVYPNWKFQPSDFVAAYGLHASLVIGKPQPIEIEKIELLSERLANFTLKLSKNGQVVAQGAGKNVLRSPALALAELATVIPHQKYAEPLQSGDFITTGTTTDAQPIAPGETWTATVEGIELEPVTLRTIV